MAACPIVGCLRCSDETTCEECNSGLKFAPDWDDDRICALPVEKYLQKAFLALVGLCVLFIVVALCVKAFLIRCGLKSSGAPTSVPETVQEQSEQELLATKNTSLKDRTKGAILYAITTAPWRRILDWSDPDRPVDAAYAEWSRGKYGQLKDEDRIVPREYSFCLNVHTKFVGGLGIPLFFNFHFQPLMFGLVLFVVTLIAVEQSGLQHFRAMYEAGERPAPEDMEASLAAYALCLRNGLAVAYAVCFIGGLAFARWQFVFARHFNYYNSTMFDYSLEVEGFDPNVVEEAKAQKILEEALGVKLIGVSIKYDLQQPGSEATGKGNDNAAEGGGGAGAGEKGAAAKQKDELWQMMERLFMKYDTEFRQDDVGGLTNTVTFGYSSSLALEEELELLKTDGDRFRSILNGGLLKGTGSVVAVFRSKNDVERILPDNNMTARKPITVDGRPCHLRRAYEPASVDWFNLGIPAERVTSNKRKAACTLLVIFLIICLCVYLPINLNINLPYAQEGGQPQPLTSQAVGVINGLIGSLLNPMLFMVAGGVGFPFKPNFDQWAMNFVMVNSFINFLVANATTLYQFLVDGFEAVQIVGTDLTHLKDDLFSEVHLAEAYFHLLVPGMLFTSWLVGKLMGDILPPIQFLLLSFLVYILRWFPDSVNRIVAQLIPWQPRVIGRDGKTRTPMSAQAAEKVWTPKWFVVSWEYPDKIYNPTITSLALFAIYDRLHYLYAFLILWVVLMYVWHRFAQFHAYMKYMNEGIYIDINAQHLFGIPVSVLAAAVAFWTHRLGQSGIFGRLLVPLFFGASLQLYSFGLCFAEHSELAVSHIQDEEEEPYERTVRRFLYDWFNTNPVYVLKSHYAPGSLGKADEVVPVVPFAYGKEYLVVKPWLPRSKAPEGEAQEF